MQVIISIPCGDNAAASCLQDSVRNILEQRCVHFDLSVDDIDKGAEYIASLYLAPAIQVLINEAVNWAVRENPT